MLRHLIAVILLLACNTVLFAQKDLYTAEHELPVTINDGWFTARTVTFGPYSTTSRENGVTKGANTGPVKDPLHPFNFRVKGKEEDILVQVIQAAHIAFLGYSQPSFLANMPSTAIFTYISFRDGKNEPLRQWELLLKDMTYLELNDNKPAGLLRSADNEIRITANNRFGAKNSYENICYEFHLRKQLLAAVVTGAHPRVWLSTETEGTPLQAVLAAAIGALLVR